MVLETTMQSLAESIVHMLLTLPEYKVSRTEVLIFKLIDIISLYIHSAQHCLNLLDLRHNAHIQVQLGQRGFSLLDVNNLFNLNQNTITDIFSPFEA